MLNKLLTKLQQKYSDNSLFQKGGFLAPAEEKELPKKIKLPLFRLMFSPFNQILDNGKTFFLLTLSAALCVSLLSSSLGFNYLCSYSSESRGALFCSNSLWGYLFYSLLKMLILGYVGIKWHDYVFNHQTLSSKSLLSVDRRYLKLSAYLLLFLFLNMLPLLSWWILYIRVPNPDWRVEMVFFAFVSIGFVMPILLFRYYSVLGFVMEGKKCPSISLVWERTSGNALKIFLSFILVLIIGIFIFGNLYSNFKILSENASLYNMFLSEYIYNFFALFIYLCILNNINMQYQILYASAEEKTDGRD